MDSIVHIIVHILLFLLSLILSLKCTRTATQEKHMLGWDLVPLACVVLHSPIGDVMDGSESGVGTAQVGDNQMISLWD